MNILITGGAGFIGSHASEHFLAQGHRVIALDNFDPYYSPDQKRRNLNVALQNSNFRLVEGDYGDRIFVSKLLQSEKIELVLHLAAQAGVRQSLVDPLKYEKVNVGSLISMLEAMRESGITRIVAASSSSVYGNTTPAPFKEDAPCLKPLSPYGATKRASEIFLGTYNGLHGLKAIIVRPFTVYGPRQRPDMAIAPFTRKILLGETITLYGDGSSARDYTYVSDIVDGLSAAVNSSPADYGIYNLGGEAPITLNDLIKALEKATGKTANLQRTSLQPGDVERTCADISRARKDLNFSPKVRLAEGLEKTVAWVREELRREGKAV
ncbi:MAG TPA: GDP-mannose 4,6-dehydratase [Planctomycetota bacterium]|nr:GDP-mannose 4,6-dehydratase [Planctomycetota bacterium]